MAGIPSYASGTTTGTNESIIGAIKTAQSNLTSDSTFSISHFTIWSAKEFHLRVGKGNNQGEYMPARDPLGLGTYEYSLVGSSFENKFALVSDIIIEETGIAWKIAFVY